jgi:hypothetical protein
MPDTAKTPPTVRELALAETEAVSGGLGLSLRDQQKLAQQSRLTDAYMSHRRFILSDDAGATIQF